MRGQLLASASLSRKYRINTAIALTVVNRGGHGRSLLPKMKRPALPAIRCCMAALLAVFALWANPQALAQDQAPPQSTSRGENFSANKPPAQLFASDCTGAGCHKGPQGLGKGQFPGMLASFLREHYTNSRESAAALAGYLSGFQSAPASREARTPPRPSKPVGSSAAVPAPAAPSGPSLSEGIITNEPKPQPSEARVPRQTPGGRTSRAAARPDDDPAATPAPPVAGPPAHPPAVEPRRGRLPAAAAAVPVEPEAAPAPPPPPPKQFDIFD
ncbi:MAG: hypothetical protein QOF91_412 [Alphaproteobacteria bacterium]|nr:hypothetical protein [Alphaproteobacteria bacterium]